MKEYMELLVNNYNAQTVGGLMCLNTVSVGWDVSMSDRLCISAINVCYLLPTHSTFHLRNNTCTGSSV